MIAANKIIIHDRQKGAFIFGPAPDGRLTRQLPSLGFATDKGFQDPISRH